VILVQSSIIVATVSTAPRTPVKISLIPKSDITVATAPVATNVNIVLTPLFLIIPAIILTEAGALIPTAITGTVVTNITATATTTSSRRLHTLVSKKKKSPDGTFDVDCVHLMETIHSFYMTLKVTDTDLAQMIPSQTKAKSVFRKKTGVCEIPLHFIFHHLESEQLTSSCEALERVFTEHTKDFLTNFKRFKGLKLSCIAKDINAQVVTRNQKKDSKKGGAKDVNAQAETKNQKKDRKKGGAKDINAQTVPENQKKDRKKGGAKDINAQAVPESQKKDRKKGGGTKRRLSTASLVTHVARPMDDALKSNGEKIITSDDPNY